MNHTSSIALALLIAFVIFVVSRQELPKYMGILGIGGYDVTADQCNSGSVVGSILGAAGSTPAPPAGTAQV